MSYKKLQNENGDMTEILSAEDEKISRLIGGLKRVEAPKDFDFRLKARIAKGKPANSGSRLLPALRYVLPLSLAAFVFAFLVLNTVYFVDNQSVPTVAEANLPTAFQNKNLPGTEILTAPESVKPADSIEPEKNLIAEVVAPKKVKPKESIISGTQFAAVKSNKTSPVVTSSQSEEKGGGSRDTALSSVESIKPKGLDARNTLENSPVLQNKTPLTTGQILSQLGIETISENGRRKVKSVTGTSLGDTSGVKVGDIIEAIDGEKISDAPLSSRTIEVRKLTITRGSEKIEISLHN